jgi:hypothetical protein
MLSKKDVALLRGMFDEVLVTRLDARDVQWNLNLNQRFHNFRLDIRDEIHSSEIRMTNRFEKRLNEVKVEIIDGITDILDEFVFPPIAELQTDMARVKDRLQMA